MVKLTRQGVRDLGSVRPAENPRRIAVRPHVIADGRPRVAVDVGASDREIAALERAGFYVAVVAEAGEPDHSWLLRSERVLVDIVISQDKEVGVWCHEHDAIWVRLHGNRKTSWLISRVREAWRQR